MNPAPSKVFRTAYYISGFPNPFATRKQAEDELKYMGKDGPIEVRQEDITNGDSLIYPYNSDRDAQRKYAFANHYYWLPCSICDQYFGGHEHGMSFIHLEDNNGRGVCRKPHCQRIARASADIYYREKAAGLV